MKLSKGDLIVIHDPVRVSGNQTGFRGLAVVESVDGTEVTVRAVDQPNAVFRVFASAIQTVYAASYVAEEMFK